MSTHECPLQVNLPGTGCTVDRVDNPICNGDGFFLTRVLQTLLPNHTRIPHPPILDRGPRRVVGRCGAEPMWGRVVGRSAAVGIAQDFNFGAAGPQLFSITGFDRGLVCAIDRLSRKR